MLETIINLSLLVLACIYIGLLLGKRSGKKELEKRVDVEREKMKEEVQKEHTELATELHGELSKVRDSIIQSAQAYQKVVTTLGDKLAPWEEVQKNLAVDQKGELPLLIVEGSSEPVEEIPEASEESSEEQGPDLGKKAAQLIKEDRKLSQATTAETKASLEKEEPIQKESGEKIEKEIPQGAARFAH